MFKLLLEKNVKILFCRWLPIKQQLQEYKQIVYVTSFCIILILRIRQVPAKIVVIQMRQEADLLFWMTALFIKDATENFARDW